VSTESFPADFAWGTATASYQIEGAATEDGRGPSIWDTYAHTPGRVRNGDTGDVACDHYHRYAEDVAIMRDLGVHTYRFSFAWPRLQPTGSGALNPGGVAFYDRLLDALAEAGVRPWVTLYHWDLPQVLEDQGGWPNRDTAARFADYAVAVHDRFADRIADWTTLNEPLCSAFLGYASGAHAPGRQEPAAAVRAAHHLLLGHGRAVAAMRSARPDHRFGITLNLYPTDPATDSPADAAAANQVDLVTNRIFLDPLLRGGYPEELLRHLEPISGLAHLHADDERDIAAPLSMLGVNYYSRHVVGRVPDGQTGRPHPEWVGCDGVDSVDTGKPKTEMGWEIDPTGMYDILRRVTAEYGPIPLYVTENGAAFADEVVDGRVADTDRIAFLDGHFRAARRAIADGVDLRGYFVWSLLDNFEWAWGYSRRFGLVRVDYDTQRRIVKDSARWYASVIAYNRVPDASEWAAGRV
jgi:beta-glucosidase